MLASSGSPVPSIFVLLFVSGYCGFWLTKWIWSRASYIRERRFWQHVRAKVEEKEPTVFSLSLEAARTQAEDILQKNVGWECVSVDEPPPEGINVLAPSLRDLFARCREIKINEDMSLIYRDDLAELDEELREEVGMPAFLPPGCSQPICISSTNDEQGALYTQPGDERIFERVNFSSAKTRGEYKTYPSIWHWIILKEFETQMKADELAG